MDKMEYILLFVGVSVLAFSVFSLFSQPKVEVDTSGVVLRTASNDNIFQQQALQAGSECGSLTDQKNVQHLSHHPDRYADCLRQVDPTVLQQATGRSIQQILG